MKLALGGRSTWHMVSGRAGINNYKVESRNQVSKHQAWIRSWITGPDKGLTPHPTLSVGWDAIAPTVPAGGTA